MEEHNFSESNVIQTLINMFRDVMNESAIRAIVESCEGDLNESVEAIMNITTDDKTVDTPNCDHPPPKMNSFTENLRLPEDPQNLKYDTSHDDDAYDAPCSQSNLLNTLPNVTSPVPAQESINNTATTSIEEVQPIPQAHTSYAKAFKTTGAIPKRQIKKSSSANNSPNILNHQIKDILTAHNQGSRILILMRGPPGCGKSYLAKQIIEMTIGNSASDFRNHIFSTDDYFIDAKGFYDFKKSNLSHAHMWNQSRVHEKLKMGLSPVIVDNTNIEIWEMETYVRMGINNGYAIKLVDPITPWAKKAQILVSKSVHKVPLTTVQNMLENYKAGITGDFLIKYFKFCYPHGLKPPVLRKFPPIIKKSENYNLVNNKIKVTDIPEKSTEMLQSRDVELGLKDNTTENSGPKKDIIPSLSEQSTRKTYHNNFNGDKHIKNPNICSSLGGENTEKNQELKDKFLELDQQFVETTIIEELWDNGESWTDQNKLSNDLVATNITPNTEIKSLVDFRDQDWTEISMFLTPWTTNQSTSQNTCVPEMDLPSVKTTTGTCIDIGDTNTDNSHNILKILTATPRDINILHIPSEVEKIPEKRMLDKSSMTNENIIITDNINFRCKNEEKHFKTFRKLFKDKNKSSLRDIFDKCCGDVNWAVDIVLDGMKDNKSDSTPNYDSSQSESDNDETCDCLAAYELIPNTTFNVDDNSQQNNVESTNVIPQKKQKKDKSSVPSEISVQLKCEIEKNIIIPDSHYSQNCLKIRKLRHGEFMPNNSHDIDELYKIDEPDDIDELENVVESDLNVQEAASINETQLVNYITNDEYLSDESSIMSETEKSLNVNVGTEFLAELDKIYGRNMVYPDGVLPKITIPVSMLNKLNALWIESLMAQMDDLTKQSSEMLLQDEELAKQIAMKEVEMAAEGREPEIPDFKEIMDMDFALSLYRKDVTNKWRNHEPNDLAAKMTREKLFNLFPEITKDVLSELLMAYDSNFQTTVEVLLTSIGKSEILAEKNGVNKFVMQKEMERKETLMEEEKKTLTDAEWPLLPTGTKVDMSTVTEYRDEATQHLQFRNECIARAQGYIGRGMTQVANYYTDVANYHKLKFEHSNSLAALSLVHVHIQNSSNPETLDLHHLRVKEAKESLDLFLDSHIRKLIEGQENGGKTDTALFFITGRGLHSPGGPKVKPAVKRRLQERGLRFNMVNPGLLSTHINVHSKLTFQIP